MKLVASLVVRNEADRYLRACLDHLLVFCDEIRILDDGSTDDFREVGWYDDERVQIVRNSESVFFQHEGRARQQLLEWTLAGDPTHVLAIDADEFVADGHLIRDALTEGSLTGVWKLTMCEVWKADSDQLQLRTDGSWSPRPIGILYEVPADRHVDRAKRRHWRIADAALACGRTPVLVTQMGNRTTLPPLTEILHFGWACQADRTERHARYVEHDGGRHHASRHLDSIMWPDSQVSLAASPWPGSLDKQRLLARVNRR